MSIIFCSACDCLAGKLSARTRTRVTYQIYSNKSLCLVSLNITYSRAVFATGFITLTCFEENLEIKFAGIGTGASCIFLCCLCTFSSN